MVEKFRNWAIRKLGGVQKEKYENACQRAFLEQGKRELLEKKLYEAERDYRKIGCNIRMIKAKCFYDPVLYEKNEDALEEYIRESLTRSLSCEILKWIQVVDEPRPGDVRCATAFVRIYVEDET